MATYFRGAPEMQPDGGLQTLYLMNPSYVGGFSDVAASPASMVLLNSTINSNSVNSINQQQHFVSIPVHQPSAPTPHHDFDSGGPIHDGASTVVQGLLPRLHQNLWAPAPTMSSRDPVVSASQQGLSLSLSQHEMAAPEMPPGRDDESKINGVTGLLMRSKYLKAVQQLLGEVVNVVGKGFKDEFTKRATSKNPAATVAFKTTATGEENTSAKRPPDLSSAEKQEVQMKKAKLVNMLEEVEQRYQQYRHQMHAVVSSFEAITGTGSARTYTALALRTISKQFRCLRDTIAGQIQATSKSLGEEEAKSVGSRLRFTDHRLKQQPALQQLGMIQNNAWRPQRGLPERSVSILRAWLFDHFLHPYPQDSDKLMLAKQTGLTRSQVSNWFINARVRLWKPMVEEMYLEQVKDQEQNTSEDMASKSDAHGSTPSKSVVEQQESKPTTAIQPLAIKKARTSEEELIADGTKSNQELLMKLMDGWQRVGEQKGSHPSLNPGYSVGQLREQYAPRFSGNGVSLTLGLQHSGNQSLSVVQPSSFLTSAGSDYMAHPSNAAAFMADRGLLLKYYQSS
ncbi:BEL1-like homeodomain protein 1 [Curcuma longa]|uniref:BEL1-like homeodomain protein 1 n=1 Tax=Curcuma longa TaxID=136217 RepID=UPI003D9F6776